MAAANACLVQLWCSGSASQSRLTRARRCPSGVSEADASDMAAYLQTPGALRGGRRGSAGRQYLLQALPTGDGGPPVPSNEFGTGHCKRACGLPLAVIGRALFLDGCRRIESFAAPHRTTLRPPTSSHATTNPGPPPMPLDRRQLFSCVSLLCVGPALARAPLPRMRAVAAAERPSVQVGAGTQAGVTTGSSGPQKEGDREGAAAGSLGSTQPGGSGSGGGPAPSPGGGRGGGGGGAGGRTR